MNLLRIAQNRTLVSMQTLNITILRVFIIRERNGNHMKSDKMAQILFDKIISKKNNPDEDRIQFNNSVNFMLREQKIKQVTLDSPVMVLWKITGKCNCSCQHCWASLGPSHSLDELVEIANEISKMNVLMVSISGGEPFLSPHLFKIIEILKSNNIIVEILTNGSLITEQIIQTLKKSLDLKTDVVQVSLDGSTMDIHDKQRNVKIFNKVVNSIKLLSLSGIKVRVSFTATTINTHDIFNTYSLANLLGVKTMSITPVFPLRKGEKYITSFDSQEYLNQICLCIAEEDNFATKLRIQVDQHFQDLIYEYRDKLDYSRLKNSGATNLKYFPNETNASIQIDAHGEVIPGPEYDVNFSGGNVYRNGLYEIWKEGRNWSEFRNGRDLRKTICSICPIYNICAGGNAKLAFDMYSTINAPDGSCLVKEKLLCMKD